jgi:hypothetical protein
VTTGNPDIGARPAPESPAAEREAEQLRYLLGLMFVLFPFLTCLPVFIIFWLGRVLLNDTFGVLAGLIYTLVPSVTLLVAHLDFVLFPLVTMGIVAPFVVGVAQRKPGYFALAGVMFVAYLYMTMAAVSIVAVLAVYLGLEALRRLVHGDRWQRVVSDLALVVVVFGGTSAALLTGLYLGVHFQPIERYTYARAIQRDWGSPDYNSFWVTANLVGYLLAFGITQSVILFTQLGRSIWRSVTASGDDLDHLSIGWWCLLLGLLAFGRQHSETNRLWAFLSPIGSLIVARYVTDLVPQRVWWLALCIFLLGVMLARYRLSYF